MRRKFVLLTLLAFIAAIALTSVRTIGDSLYLYSYDDQDLRTALAGSELIVVGRFNSGWPLPWLDGWHYRSSLHIRDVLAGNPAPGSIPFSWQRPFGVDLLCNDMRHLDGRPGVWFLRKHSSEWQLVSRRDGFCDEPIVAPELQAIKDVIRHGVASGGVAFRK
jgi:hypothetical protein